MQTARPVRLGARHAAGSNAAIRGARAAAPRARAAASRLVVRAEKVVGIDLGTTNSAVRCTRCEQQAPREADGS